MSSKVISIISLISSSAVPLYPLWSRAPFGSHFYRFQGCWLLQVPTMSPPRSSHSQTCAATSKSHATSGMHADVSEQPEKLNFIARVPWAINTALPSAASRPTMTATPSAGLEAPASLIVELELAWPGSEAMPVSILASSNNSKEGIKPFGEASCCLSTSPLRSSMSYQQLALPYAFGLTILCSPALGL